jgi:hypothetical protein
MQRRVVVKLINTDGMAFIGPGSEWFWTALSGIVLAVTFIAIYRQLRLQRSQGAIEQIDAFTREWNSERLLSYRLTFLVALQDGTDPAHLPAAAAQTLSNYWEGIGALARAGYLDWRLLWDNHGNTSQLWWGYLGPYCRATRAQMEEPGFFENFEWLAAAMDAKDRGAGRRAIYSEARLTSMLDDGVNYTRERLRIEQSLRTVIFASPEAAPAAPAATAATEGRSGPDPRSSTSAQPHGRTGAML